MKKLIYILTIIFGTGVVSCKKFLEEENLGGITSETYFSDANGYEALITASYASLRSIYGINPSLFEWGTDITTRGEIDGVSGAVNDIHAVQLNEYKTLTADNTAVNEFFTRAYAGIQRCNTAINKAISIPGLTENTKSRRTAEMRFLRAYYYYLLVENFGGIPIVTEEFTGPVSHFVPGTEQQVYDFMIAELSEALPNLEADPTKIEPGRVTQGAVKHLLSLIYLTRGYKSFGSASDFVKSAEIAEELISSSYYTLLPSFASVFTPGNEQNKEIIFSVQYELLPGVSGNGQNILFGWRYFREAGFDEVAGLKDYNRRRSDFMPTQFLYTLYNTAKDSRYDATFISQLRAVKEQGSIKKGDLRFYFPYPDQPFTDADEATLVAANPNVVVVKFDQWKPVQVPGGVEKFPMIIKFYDPNAALPGSNEFFYTSTKDVFLFRLAETYLIAAEAYFKAGRPGDAAAKLNVLRARAAKTGQTLDISAGDVTIDFILDERARELAGEYKRWLDLKRTRRLDRAFQHNILTNIANGPAAQDKYYLRPIPQTVIDRDTGGYPQNSGY